MPILTPEAPRQSIDALSAMLSTLALSARLKQAAPHFAARIAASPHEIRSNRSKTVGVPAGQAGLNRPRT